MVKVLSEKESQALKDLDKNFEDRLLVFKKEHETKSKEDLKKIISDLENYLKGCYSSEIDDTLINIRFIERKVMILKNFFK